jgi:ATP-dependent Clp protease ATP-binding subunit ClpC
LAEQKASEHHHRFVCTGHLLLALTLDTDSLAAKVLSSLNLSIDAMRQRAELAVSEVEQSSAPVVFGADARAALEYASEEADLSGMALVSTEHLLLGLLREEQGVAHAILIEFGVDLNIARRRVAAFLGRDQDQQPSVGLDPASATVLAELKNRLDETRLEKQEAIDAGNNDTALFLREREKALLVEISRLRPRSN